jgi:5-formyltetrahydrofolate cyclo-ligase
LFIYLSFSSEAPTDALIERLLEEKHKVYCPRVGKNEMQAVLYGEDFYLSHYGIREPIGEVLQEEVDVIVLPLLAVDKKGNRLGYGKGYYDAYLRAHPFAKRVAYCYDFQVCQSLPTEAFDEKVDVIITDKRVINTRIQEKNGETQQRDTSQPTRGK